MAIPSGISVGESTQNQLQLIYPVSSRPTKRTVSIPRSPIPPDDEEDSLGISILQLVSKFPVWNRRVNATVKFFRTLIFQNVSDIVLLRESLHGCE